MTIKRQRVTRGVRRVRLGTAAAHPVYAAIEREALRRQCSRAWVIVDCCAKQLRVPVAAEDELPAAIRLLVGLMGGRANGSKRRKAG